MVAAGKSRIVYLLSGSSLGGIGGQQAELGDACDDDIDGGAAVWGRPSTCPASAARSPYRSQPPRPGSICSGAPGRRWAAHRGGRLVWTIGSDGVLYGLEPSSGAVQEQATIGSPANHFPTPSVGADLLLAPSANRVVAFAAVVGRHDHDHDHDHDTHDHHHVQAPGPTRRDQPLGHRGRRRVAGLAVLGGLTWFLRRRGGAAASTSREQDLEHGAHAATTSETDTMTATTRSSGRCMGSQSPMSANWSSSVPSASAHAASPGGRSSRGRGSRVAR